jgi:hypothetical protein
MPIRSIPLDQINEKDIASLKERRVREDQTLDYKQELDVRSDKGKFELLKDVTALANAAGGVILYGATEGEGDDAGLITDLPGLTIEVDKTQNTIDQLLHDGIDERISGVRHRAIQRSDGRHYLIVRVPPSHLAPHMVRINFPNVRFYQRGTTSNQPMNARQIKEASLRAATALDRAKAFIAERIAIASQRVIQREHGTDRVLLHVVPLFGPLDSLDLASQSVVERLKKVPVFGTDDDRYCEERFALEGFYRELKAGDEVWRYNLFLRNGAMEFQECDILRRGNPPRTELLFFKARTVEEDILEMMKHVQGLTEAGMLQLPILVGITVIDVQGSVLDPEWTSRRMFHATAPTSHRVIALDPVLISDWGTDLSRTMKRVFDIMWQAWGWPSSGSYGDDGTRMTG